MRKCRSAFRNASTCLRSATITPGSVGIAPCGSTRPESPGNRLASFSFLCIWVCLSKWWDPLGPSKKGGCLCAFPRNQRNEAFFKKTHTSLKPPKISWPMSPTNHEPNSKQQSNDSCFKESEKQPKRKNTIFCRLQLWIHVL